MAIEDVRAIDRPMKNFEWEVQILGPSTGGEPGLTARAQSVTIPETSVDTIEINHKSEKTVHSGRVASPRTMTISFFDDEDLTVYRFMRNWSALVHNENTGAGVNRAAYIANVLIQQFASDSSTVVANHTIIGAFPTSIGDVSLTYEGSEVMTVEVTLAFQTQSTD